MQNGDKEQIKAIINEALRQRDRLTKEDVEEVVKQAFLQIGINTKDEDSVIRTQQALGFLFRLNRFANSVITKLILALLAIVLAGSVMTAEFWAKILK